MNNRGVPPALLHGISAREKEVFFSSSQGSGYPLQVLAANALWAFRCYPSRIECERPVFTRPRDSASDSRNWWLRSLLKAPGISFSNSKFIIFISIPFPVPLILPATTNSCGYRRMRKFGKTPDSNSHKIRAERFRFTYQHKLVMPDSEGTVAAPLPVEIFAAGGRLINRTYTILPIQ